MQHVKTLHMTAFELPHDKALPALPNLHSPTLTDPDLVLPNEYREYRLPAHMRSPPRRHGRPPSPGYLREKTHEEANTRNVADAVTPPHNEKRGLASRKMLLRRRTNSNGSLHTPTQSVNGSSRGNSRIMRHSKDHPSISTLDEGSIYGSSPTLIDRSRLAPGRPTQRSGSHSGSSVTSDELAGMPEFLAKYKAASEGTVSGDSKGEEEEDDDQGDSATVIEDGVEAQRRQQEKDEKASAVLSKRAEQILANAKARLNLMEGNLRGARDLVAPLTAANLKRAASLGSSQNPTNRFQSNGYHSDSHQHEQGVAQPMRILHSQASSPTMSGDYQGHTRNFSANFAVYDRPHTAMARNPSFSRQPRLPVKVDDTPVDHVLRSSRSYDSFGNNVMYHAVSRDRAYRGSPDSNLEPLLEDDDQHSRLNRYDRNNSGLGLSRHSPSIPDDLRSQMSSLKGKISTLKERAREDSLRRKSYSSLKTPSPFSNATADAPEFYYSQSQSSGSPVMENSSEVARASDHETRSSSKASLRGRASPAVLTGNRNAFAERATAERQQHDRTLNRTPTQDGDRRFGPGLRSPGDHRRTPSGTAIIQSAKSRYSHHRYNSSRSSSSTIPGAYVESDVDDDRASSDGSDGSRVTTTTKYTQDIDEGASVYEDAEDMHAEPTAVPHEDRDDAFDYEHFFLTSAMGIHGNARKGSNSSEDSISSSGTARGPRELLFLSDEDGGEEIRDDYEYGGIFPPPTPETPERLRQIERKLHRRTISGESIASFATANEQSNSRPTTYLSRYSTAITTAEPDWPMPSAQPSHPRPGTAIRRTIPSDASSDRADSGVGGLPPRAHSSAETGNRKSRPNYQPQSAAGFHFATYPPISPTMDPTTLAVRALLNPNSKILGLKDKALLFSFVDSLRATCRELQESEEGQYINHQLRQRLEAAKLALEGG